MAHYSVFHFQQYRISCIEHLLEELRGYQLSKSDRDKLSEILDSLYVIASSEREKKKVKYSSPIDDSDDLPF